MRLASENRRLTAIGAKVAETLGYTLVDAELAREKDGSFLRFYIDREGGVSLDDCEKFHKAVRPETESVDYDYLEVSSPGADRPLTKAADFQRNEGRTVSVKLYKPENGVKTFTGALAGLAEGRVVIRTPDEMAFDLIRVASVTPMIDLDEALAAPVEMEISDTDAPDA